MPARKKILASFTATIAALLLALTLYYFSGSSAIESFVATQLLDTAATYLEPTLHFDKLTYRRPRTILLDNITLTSPDPGNANKPVVILAIKHARLELAEIPRKGRPVQFTEIILDAPEFHGIAAEPGKPALLGFAHLLKKSTAASSAPAAAPGHAPMKLSDFLRIRHLAITDGTAFWDPRRPNTPPFSLDSITTDITFAPAPPTTDPGLYTLAATVARTPALDLALKGTLNLDTLIAEISTLDLTVDLQTQNAHALPPDLQRLFATHDVTGLLRLSTTGTLPFKDVRARALHTNGTLTAANAAFGDHRFPIDSLTWEITTTHGLSTLNTADAKLLGGTLHITGTMPLDRTIPAQFAIAASKLQIQQLLRTTKPNEPPRYAGLAAFDLTFAAPIALWKTQAAGAGTLSIRDGRLDQLPMLGQIITDLNQFLAKSLTAGAAHPNDSIDGAFHFAGNGIQVDRFIGTSGVLAFRGAGAISFDRTLDLRLNAGPLERLQNALGDFGQAWASLSDSVANYHVTGTTTAPNVNLELGH